MDPEVVQPLAGLRVLDLADGSGLLCGRFLADLGADVVKVEPPAGDPARRLPPFADDRPELERSLTWLAGNLNKRGITCNLEVESGRDLLRRLVERADVLVETAPHDLGDHPRLIVASLTPYGLDGPLADQPASDLEVTAAAGSLWLAGEADGEPVRSTLPQSPAWTGMYAAVGVLLAVLEREVSGLGQRVDVSAQESMLTAISHAPLFWDLLREEQVRSGGNIPGRNVEGAAVRNIWPCRDGYVTFALYGGPAGRETARALVAWMDERGGAPAALKAIDWERFDLPTAPASLVETIQAAIEPFFRRLSKAEFFEEVQRRRMLGYPVATADETLADEQLAAREFWQRVPTGWDGWVECPGGFALFDGRRLPIRRPAPRLGEHNLEVYGELGLSAQDLVGLRAAGVL